MNQPVLTKNAGKISPPYHGAFYEQDGHFFDAKKRPMGKDHNGLPIPLEVKEEAPAETKAESETLSASELLRRQNMPIGQWKAHCKRLLGPDSPGTKAEIMPLLNELAKNEPAIEPEREPEAPVEAGPDEDVDLALWGRGKKNYLMGKVFKAIRDTYDTDVGSQFAAVEFLISEGIVTEAQARKVS